MQDVLLRLDKAFDAFFRRVKQGGEELGFPKFKKYGTWCSITFPQYSKRPSQTIYVPKVGTVKCVTHWDIPADAIIKTLTISKDGCKWFASVSATPETLATSVFGCHETVATLV